MKVTVNGQSTDVPQPCSVGALLERLNLGRSPCAVEVNRRLVPKRQHAEQAIDDGDIIEIVSLVGGG